VLTNRNQLRKNKKKDIAGGEKLCKVLLQTGMSSTKKGKDERERS